MIRAHRSRWALSFADLALLLLGFFVLLQASGSRRDAVLSEMRSSFGAKAPARAVTLRAADLFQPGEAVLTRAGEARVARALATLPHAAMQVELRSEGLDGEARRFDAWDLAAARLGALARAVRAAGVAPQDLVIRGLDQRDGAQGRGQHVHISVAPRPKGD